MSERPAPAIILVATPGMRAAVAERLRQMADDIEGQRCLLVGWSYLLDIQPEGTEVDLTVNTKYPPGK